MPMERLESKIYRAHYRIECPNYSAQEEPPERKKKTRAPKKPENVESTQCATTKDYETTEETSQASTTGDRSPQIYRLNQRQWHLRQRQLPLQRSARHLDRLMQSKKPHKLETCALCASENLKTYRVVSGQEAILTALAALSRRFIGGPEHNNGQANRNHSDSSPNQLDDVCLWFANGNSQALVGQISHRKPEPKPSQKIKVHPAANHLAGPGTHH